MQSHRLHIAKAIEDNDIQEAWEIFNGLRKKTPPSIDTSICNMMLKACYHSQQQRHLIKTINHQSREGSNQINQKGKENQTNQTRCNGFVDQINQINKTDKINKTNKTDKTDKTNRTDTADAAR